MGKLSKKTKKMLSLFLAILLVITGTSIASVFADEADKSDFEALGNSDLELGESGSRLSLEVKSTDAQNINYVLKEFGLKVTSPSGVVTVELPSDMDYPKESNAEAETAGLIAFNEKTRMLTINFVEADTATDLGSSNIETLEDITSEVKDSEVLDVEDKDVEVLDGAIEVPSVQVEPKATLVNEEYKDITVNLVPKLVKDYTIKAQHNEGDKAEVVVSVKSLISPLSASVGAFASYDGKDLVSNNEFDFSANRGFILTPKLLSVTPNFGSPTLYTSKTLTIELKPGIALSSAPGLKSVGGGVWVYDSSKQSQGDLHGSISNVTFTRNSNMIGGIYRPLGGTIVYEFTDGTGIAPVNMMVIGEMDILAGPQSSAISLTPDIIDIKAERAPKATPEAKTVIASAKVNNIKALTGHVILHTSTYTNPALVEPDKNITVNGIFTQDTGYGVMNVTSATAVYTIPPELTVINVTGAKSYTIVGNKLTLQFDAFRNDKYFYVTVKANNDPANIGKTVALVPTAETKFSSAFATDAVVSDRRNLRLTIVGPFTDKIDLKQGLNRNLAVPVDDVIVPLGGFSGKNNQAQALTDQRVKLVFDDPNMTVKTVRLYSNSKVYKGLMIKTISGNVYGPKDITGDASNTSFNIVDLFENVASDDGIAEVIYQMPTLPSNAVFGHDAPGYVLFYHMAYFGKTSLTNVGDTATAKMYTTTSADADFTSPNVQTTTTTTTITGDKLGVFTGGSSGEGTFTPGSTVSLNFNWSPTYRNIDVSLLSLSYIKGWSFFMREIPNMTLIESDVRVYNNGTEIPPSTYTIEHKTDNTGKPVTKFSVPSALTYDNIGDSSNIDAATSSITIALKYKVQKSSPSFSGSFKDHFYAMPINDQIATRTIYGHSVAANNVYDVNGDGRTGPAGLVPAGSVNIGVVAMTDFNITTAANLDNGLWETYDYTDPNNSTNGTIILNPAGNAKYKLSINNNSDKPADEFMAFIPIPKVGEGVGNGLVAPNPGAYNPVQHVQKANFGWTVNLDPANPPHAASTNLSYTYKYATSYNMTDVTNNVAIWKDWDSIADKSTIRTVRISSTAPIANGSSDDITFPLKFDEATADAQAGQVNTYSAYIYTKVEGATNYKGSQPISIVLKTGVVSGLVFSDVNGNGVKDPSETGIPSIQVKAYKTGNISDAGLIETLVTDADGKYRFAGLDKTQDVDIVFVNPADISSLKFSVPASTDNHVTAVFKQLTPSGGSYQGVNAGLIPAKVLNFNLNGADGTAPASIAKFPGELVPSIADVAWANYTFNGWFTKATGGTKITPTATTTIDDILNKITADGGTNTLYAQWTRKTATITVQHYTYKDNISGAVQNGADVVSAGVNHGTTFTAVKKTIAGHTYKSADPSESVVVSGDVTIKLYYQADTKKITVNHYTYTNALTDKVLVGSSTTVNKYYGESYTEAEKTITGYTYDATNSVKTVTGITADTTLNLYYQANPAVITVEHYTYTATTSDAVLSGAKETINKRYGESYTATPRTIAGHAYNSGLSTFEITSITGPATLKLYYQAGAHTVTVNHYTYTNNVSDKVLNGAPDSASKFFGQSYTATQRTIPGYTYASANPSLTVTVTGNTTIDLFYQADQKVITVEHYTYTDNIGAAVLNGTADTVNKRYGESFTATKRVIPGHTYDSVGSVDTIASITENATLKLYYKAGSHTVTVKHYTYINTTADAVINGTDDTESKFYGESFAATHRTITGYTYDTANPSDTIAAVTAPATLNLYYKANLYDVTFNSDNGVADVVQQFPYQSKIIKPAIDPVKTGYTFDKWVKESDGTEWNFTTDTMPLNGIALKATYTVNSYKVTFDSNLGSAVVPAQVSYDFGTKLTQPVSTRPGYTLEGWYTLKPDGITLDTKWDFAADSMPAVNFTLKANWTVDTSKTVSVTFSPEGGTYTGPAADLLQVKNAGSVLVEPNVANLKKPGYKLDGWYTGKLGVGTKWIFTTTLEDARFIDTTLYANWVDDNAQSITVKYNLNGGKHSGITTIPDQQVFVKGYVTEPTGAMTKEGHTFGSWNIEGSDGKPTSNKWNFSTQITHENFNDVKLIAVWDVVKYNVTFDSDNGSTSKVVAFDFGTKLTAPTVPTKEGHTFDAWYNVDNTGNLTTKWNFATDTMPANGITLKAKWNVNSYKVSIDSDNGSAVVTQNVLFNQKAVKPILNPVKTGYTFEDWYLADSTGNLVSVWNFATNLVPSRDITIKAKWNLNSYQIEVEHYTYDTDINTPTLEKTVTATVNHFESYTAKPIEIPYHTFQKDKSNPANPTISVTGPAKFKLYYNADHYTMTLTNQLDLDVNDKYPAKDNKPSWDQIVQLLNAKTVNSNDKTKLFATKAAPVSFTSLTSSDYANVDFSATTSGYTQTFNVKAVWGNGDTQTLPVTVKISDKVAPVISNLTDSRKFELQAGKTAIYSEKDLMKFVGDLGIGAIDNYDGNLEMTISYAGSGGFSSIKWNEVGEYGFYLTATDSSGNTIRKAAAISIYSVTEGDSSGGNNGGNGSGSGNKPDTSTPINPGNNGSGNAGTDNNGSGNNGSGNSNDKIPQTGGGGGDTNSPGGNSFDKDGNLIDANGNILVNKNDLPKGSEVNSAGQLIDSKGNLINLNGLAGGKLPSTGIVAGGASIGLVALASVLLLVKKIKKKLEDETI